MPYTYKDMDGGINLSRTAAIESSVKGIGQCSLGGYNGTSGEDILRRYRASGASEEEQIAFVAELRRKYR